jgi:hypothetical protein
VEGLQGGEAGLVEALGLQKFIIQSLQLQGHLGAGRLGLLGLEPAGLALPLPLVGLCLQPGQLSLRLPEPVPVAVQLQPGPVPPLPAVPGAAGQLPDLGPQQPQPLLLPGLPRLVPLDVPLQPHHSLL